MEFRKIIKSARKLKGKNANSSNKSNLVYLPKVGTFSRPVLESVRNEKKEQKNKLRMHYVMDYLRPNQKVMRDRAWAKQKLHSVKASAILIVLIIGVRYALCSLIQKIWGAERRHIQKEEF